MTSDMTEGYNLQNTNPLCKSVCVWVCVHCHTWKFLNCNLTHLKPKIKHQNLVNISGSKTHTMSVCICLLGRGVCLWESQTPAWSFPPCFPPQDLEQGSASVSRYSRCSLSCSWNQIFKDGASFESPNEVTRFTARFGSLEADHLSAYVVLGMEHLLPNALSYLLLMFQQKVLRCWSLLANWFLCVHTGLLQHYQKILINTDHLMW